MSDNPTVVTINNTDYYAPSDAIDYLFKVGNRIVNTSNSTVYLYGEFREYGNSYSGYPRITCPSNTYCYLTTSYNSNYQTLNVSSYEVKARTFSDLFLIGTVTSVNNSITDFKQIINSI